MLGPAGVAEHEQACHLFQAAAAQCGNKQPQLRAAADGIPQDTQQRLYAGGVASLKARDGAVQRRVVEVEGGLKKGLQHPLQQAVEPGQTGFGRGGQGAQLGVHNILHQQILMGVVIGQVAHADAQGIGDIAHRDSPVSTLVEQFTGSVPDQFLGGFHGVTSGG